MNELVPATVERFWSHVVRTESDWLWGAYCDADGYGILTVNGRHWRAHRLSWVLAHGRDPADRYVLHHCDVRRCIRPSHLYLGDALDNARDVIRRDRRRYLADLRSGQLLLFDRRLFFSA